jgi:hypothetical protein
MEQAPALPSPVHVVGAGGIGCALGYFLAAGSAVAAALARHAPFRV